MEFETLEVPTITADEMRADADKALQQLAKVTTTARELARRDHLDREKLKELAGEMRTVQQALVEHQARGNASDNYAESERGLRQWVDDGNGEVVLSVDTDRGTQRVYRKGRVESRAYDPRSDVHRSGILDGDEVHGAWHRRLLELTEQLNIVRVYTADHNGRNPQTRRTEAALRAHLATAPGSMKRIFTDSSGVGAEWIPDTYLPLLWEAVWQERRVEALFMGMPMSDKTLIVPYLAYGLRPYIKGQPTTDSYGTFTPSSLPTANRTKVAKGLAVRYIEDEDASEDSIIDMMPLIRAQLTSAIVDATEDAIINGDNQGAHGDTGIASWDIAGRWGTSGLGGTDDHRRIWMGLRHMALAITGGGGATASADGSGAQTAAGMAGWRKAMGRYGARVNDLAYITSIEWYLGYIVTFDETETLEKYGPQASILTGEVGRIYGAPIVISDFMSPDLNASGIYDASTLDYTGALCVNRSRFMMGNRRGVQLERAKVIASGVYENVATRRCVFFGLDNDDSGWATGTTVPVYYAYKLTD